MTSTEILPNESTFAIRESAMKDLFRSIWYGTLATEHRSEFLITYG